MRLSGVLLCSPIPPAIIEPLANVICNYIRCDGQDKVNYYLAHILTSFRAYTGEGL